jgi:ribosome-associated heat shock protein Hsp15
MTQGARDGAAPAVSQRLDKWLWYARFVKTRSLAGKLCQSGLVRVAGDAVTKANRSVRIGDVVAVPQGRVIRTVEVKALGDRRGPPAEARRLYDEIETSHLRDLARESWTPLLLDED